MRFRDAILVYSMVFASIDFAAAQEIVTTGDITVGARALGMGGAQIAAANDLTAIINNPAALTRIGQTEFQLGFVRLNRDIHSILSDDITLSGSDNSSNLELGTVGFSYAVPTERGSLAFAVGYNRVKDFSGNYRLSGYSPWAFENDDNGDGTITDDEIWGGDETLAELNTGGMDVLSFAAAVDVSPQVSIGGSIDYWKGDYKRDITFLRNNFEEYTSWLDIETYQDDITGWSFKPSILYSKDKLRLGAYATLPLSFDVKEEYLSDQYSRNDGVFFSTGSSPSMDFNDTSEYDSYSYKINPPKQFGAGIALGVPEKRMFAADLVYENWQEAEIKDEYDPYYFSGKYRSTFGWRVGFEHGIPWLDAALRVGYIRQPLSFEGPRGDDPRDPEIKVDNPRDFVTAGFGTWIDESFRLDAAYAHGFFRTTEGSRRDEETHDRFSLSMLYRLPVQ